MKRDKDESVERLVAEWVERRRAGEHLPAEEWIARHPRVANDLRRAIAAMQRLGDVLPVAAPDAPPHRERIGEYRVLREIGRGGMGVVYEAEQAAMNRRVALKVLYPSITNTAQSVERFRREARAAGGLKHTNIVTVHQLGEDAGTWFCAMELVDGHSLDKVLEDVRRLRPPAKGRPRKTRAVSSGAADTWRATTGERRYFQRVAEMFAEIADALQLAHDHGVVHRDVKPANLMVSSDGRLKILDFGLARIREDPSGLTVTGGMVGTPSYMSPEQARSAPVDARSDVYSLGATMYEVLTLRPPFHAKDIAEILQKLRAEEPRPPSRLDRRIPRDFETIVLKALEKDASKRYATAGELAKDLRAFAEGRTIVARRVGVVARGWRVVKRNRMRSALAAALVACVVTGVAYAVHRSREIEADRVEREYWDLLNAARRCVDAGTNKYELTGSQRVEAPAWGRALELVTAARDLSPERCDAYQFRSGLTDGRLPDALRDLDEARVRGLPERVFHLIRAGMFKQERHDAESAAEYALALAAPDELDAFTAQLEGAYLVGVGRASDAIDRLNSALARARDGRSSSWFDIQRTLYARASARESVQDFAGAIEDLSRVRSNLASPDAYIDVRIASLWRRLGKEDVAQASLDGAVAAARADGSAARWLSLSQALRSVGETTRREVALREALVRHPRDAALLYAAGQLALDRMELERAAELADAAITAGGDDATARYARSLREEVAVAVMNRAGGSAGTPSSQAAGTSDSGRQSPDREMLEATRLLAEGKGEDALRLAEAIAAAHPDDHHVQHNFAMMLGQLGRWAEALPVTERAVGLDMHCGGCWAVKVWVLDRLGRPADAVAAAEQALKYAPECGELRLHQGRALEHLGRRDEALHALDEAIRLTPGSAYALQARGTTLSRMGRAEESITASRKALAIDPRQDVARFNVAAAYYQLRRFRDVVAETEIGRQEHPNSPAWNAMRGLALWRLNENAACIESLRNALRLDAASAPAEAGDHPEFNSDLRLSALFSLGHALNDLGNVGEARAWFEKFVAAGPPVGSVADVDRLAFALRRLGRERDSATAYETGLRAFPRDPYLANGLAWHLATSTDVGLRDPARAVGLLKEVVSPETSDGNLWNTFGVALCTNREWRESLDALQKSMDLRKGGDANDWFFVAIAHKRLGDDADARTWFDKAVAWTAEHDPKNEELARFQREAAEALGLPVEKPATPEQPK